MDNRASGILIHISSLPSVFGIGDIGSSARAFADFLGKTKQRYWQVLPLTPTCLDHGNSPYHSDSAFALNPLFIDPLDLVSAGWLLPVELADHETPPGDQVDYRTAAASKTALLNMALNRMKEENQPEGYREFIAANGYWLEDYSLFKALKLHFAGRKWFEWPAELRDRHHEALDWARNEFTDIIRTVKLSQFLLSRQWLSLRNHCRDRGVRIIGDLPIYVVDDSADVWVHPELFNLDHEKRPITVAGVPPDYFSETGQLWGNPVYRWEVMKELDYQWWIQRIRYTTGLYDLIRVDHFRGFAAYWEIPAHEPNAVNGRWVQAPGWDFFNRITREFDHLPIIAEDLGLITDDVRELIRHFRFPGMKILQFAFGDDLPTNPYAPHNLERNCILYTGTHDNNTTKGWYENEASAEIKKRLSLYIGEDLSADSAPRALTRLAMMSVANTVILPMQDLLGLGAEARMNKPGTQENNWKWRLPDGLLTPELADELLAMTEIYGRGWRR